MSTRQKIRNRLEEQEGNSPSFGGGLEIVISNYRAEEFDDPLDPDYSAAEPHATRRVGYDENGNWQSELTDQDSGNGSTPMSEKVREAR